MSTNQTKHYGLHAWEAADRFLRAEFNENFGLIDMALWDLPDNKKLRIITGTYVGTNNGPQTLALGFAPKVVLVACRDSGSYYHASLVFPEADTLYAKLSGTELTVTGCLNLKPSHEGSAEDLCNPYRYIAIGWEE